MVMLGSFFRSKIDQKIIKIQHRFWIVFGRFWDPSWRHLGGQNRPKMVQGGLKTAFDTLFFQKRECSRNIGSRSVWSVSRAPRQHPKRPKIAPRRPQDGLISVLFSLRFLHRFLVAFWCDFGAIWGGFGESKSVILGIDFLMIFACRSKSGPRAAKSGPRAAKSRQERPKSGPRAAKSGPKPPKRSPG